MGFTMLRYLGCLVILILMRHAHAKGQEVTRKKMDNLTYEVHSKLGNHFQDPLFFVTNYELDAKVRMQFGLRKSGEPKIDRLHFSPGGDTLFLDFRQQMQAYEGRLDWSLDAKVARFSHHAPFGPSMTMYARIQFPVLMGRSPSLRPHVSIRWMGERMLHVMKWEIDLPFFAEKTIRAKIMAAIEELSMMFTLHTEHVVSGRNDWSDNPMSNAFFENSMTTPPPDILQHRKVRIQHKRRVVEDLTLDGDWHTRVWLRPDFGVHGGVLTDFFFQIRGDQVTEYRYEFLQSRNLKPSLQFMQADLAGNIQDWMDENHIHAYYFLLLKADAPYDYVLQVKSDNPDEQRSYFLYALSRDNLVLRIITERSKSELLRFKRVPQD
jgi:hypothetical protein